MKLTKGLFTTTVEITPDELVKMLMNFPEFAIGANLIWLRKYLGWSIPVKKEDKSEQAKKALSGKGKI